MVRCVDCKYATNVVRFEKDEIFHVIEIWNKYCNKKEQVVTDTYSDDRACEDYEHKNIFEDFFPGSKV